MDQIFAFLNGGTAWIAGAAAATVIVVLAVVVVVSARRSRPRMKRSKQQFRKTFVPMGEGGR